MGLMVLMHGSKDLCLGSGVRSWYMGLMVWMHWSSDLGLGLVLGLGLSMGLMV